MDNLRQYALAIIFHQSPKTRANRIHSLARRTCFIHEQEGVADLDLFANKFDQIDAGGFDIRAHSARRNGLQTKRRGVLGNLLSFNQADLPTAGLARSAAEFAKITWLTGDSLAGHQFNLAHRLQWFTRLGWMQVQRSHAAGRGCGRRWQIHDLIMTTLSAFASPPGFGVRRVRVAGTRRFCTQRFVC